MANNFSVAKSARLAVVGVLSLALGLIGAFQIQPSLVSAQAAGEMAKVCETQFLFATTGRSASASDITACETGYKGSGSGQTMAAACRSYTANSSNRFFCEQGYKQQQNQAGAGVALSDSQLQAKAEEVCNGGSAPEREKTACRNGFREGYRGLKTKAEACGDQRPTPYSTDGEKKACEKAFDEGEKLLIDRGGFPAAADPDVDCTSTGAPLSWIACPIIDMGSYFTDFVFKDFVRPMLENVPISANPADAGYKAWQGFRLLGNLLLVGTLLAIVYGQTRGGGGR